MLRNRRGVIVNMASMAHQRGGPGIAKTRNLVGAGRRTIRADLLPNLLPNSVARGGTKWDHPPQDRSKLATKMDHLG
jgi:hypothetical protein